MPTTARGLLALVKAERRAIAAAGVDWQGLPRAIRPHVLPLWRGASNAERLRFARHLRAFWDVTAHRAAPPAHEALRRVQAEGRFTAEAGRVMDLVPGADGIEATLRWRQSGAVQTLQFGGVVNCRGHQEHDWRRIADPLVRQLLARGLVRSHETGFGIDADLDGALIDADGLVHDSLFAIGHPLRGVAWESSSIGEQLALAIALADRLQHQDEPVRASA